MYTIWETGSTWFADMSSVFASRPVILLIRIIYMNPLFHGYVYAAYTSGLTRSQVTGQKTTTENKTCLTVAQVIISAANHIW